MSLHTASLPRCFGVIRTFALIVCTSLAPVLADSFRPAKPETFSSPSGTHLVRMEAADSVEDSRGYWKQTEFNVFTYDEASESYRRAARFNVEGHPEIIFINDTGTHIVTLDQRFGSGYAQVAAIYNLKGERLAQWTLQDLFGTGNIFDLRSLPQFRRSTSSIYWRGDARWSHDQKGIWIDAPHKVEYREDGSYSIIHPSNMDTYSINPEKLEMKRVPPSPKEGKPPAAKTK
jgi:hypothetical protein